LLGPVSQRRVGLAEKRDADGVVKYDLPESEAGDRILESDSVPEEAFAM
jgi:hypothetical protein